MLQSIVRSIGAVQRWTPIASRLTDVAGQLAFSTATPSTPSDKPKPRGQVWIGNLPYKTRKQDVLDAFSAYGATEVVFLKFKDTGKPKGMAYVRVADDKIEQAINEVNGRDFNGRTMKVAAAKTAAPAGPQAAAKMAAPAAPQAPVQQAAPAAAAQEAAPAAAVKEAAPAAPAAAVKEAAPAAPAAAAQGAAPAQEAVPAAPQAAAQEAVPAKPQAAAQEAVPAAPQAAAQEAVPAAPQAAAQEAAPKAEPTKEAPKPATPSAA